MSEKVPRLGSSAWADMVWSTPPVDTIKGRSRWTQAHQPWCKPLARHAAMQGRLEYIALLVLMFLHMLGLIVRFKDHPFATSAEDLGREIRPDLLAQDNKNRLITIELKTARFVTPAVQLQLDANRKGLKPFGLEYLVWHDHHPLTHPVRHNLQHMRRAASEDVQPAEIARLCELIGAEGEIPWGALVARGFDTTCVLAACWQGRAFLPLTRPIEDATMIRDHSHENYSAIFLDEKPLHDDWWENLNAS
ncbi:MAG: hypothetical protein PHY45_09060 [Rhodocyclaceae bacterium]|nr:hypothetical protein [Rhodocyclaceae bacterium]